MDNEKIYTEYNDEKNRIPWLRIILSVVIVILVIAIIFLLLRACGKTTLRTDIIDAAKKYNEKYQNNLPETIGECNIVTLSALEKEGLIDSKKYSTCDKATTYVNVCHLENSKYNYAANLSCDKETTKYGMWKDGSVADLTEGLSDVRFKFVGQELTQVPDGEQATLVKHYYPSDSTDASKVNSYYISVPKNGYTERESASFGYKWYTETDKKEYWNNGEYSATAPSGFISYEDSKEVVKYSDTKPEEASYRKIEEITLYRYKRVSKVDSFVCVIPGTNAETDASIVSSKHCSLREDNFKEVYKAYYTCDGITKTDTIQTCEDYTAYTEEACSTSRVNGIECESKTSYKYTDTVHKWYKETKERSYYPSKSTSASGEKTYYLTAPVAGAIKDEKTGANVYKFYKPESKNNVNMVEKFIDVTNGYVEIDELLATFNNLGYEVNSLKDVNAIDKIRYDIKMQYRNIEE